MELNKFIIFDKLNILNNPLLKTQLSLVRKFNEYKFYLFPKNYYLSSLFFYNKFFIFKFFIFKFYIDFLFISKKLDNESYDLVIYVLNLNFKRNRFFPQLKDLFSKKTIFNNSLGIISRYFSLKKSYLRSKSSYVLSSVYLRRLLVNSGVLKLRLEITKIPKYFRDVLRILMANSNVLYKNPFSANTVIDEKKNPIKFIFPYITFLNNKPNSVIKTKKRGRLKRKISKKVVLLNNILD